MPAFAQGCPGKILRPDNRAKRPTDFVLAGLVPWAFSPRTSSVGIHAFESPKQRRGCADQVRARQRKIDFYEDKTGSNMAAARLASLAPAGIVSRSRGDGAGLFRSPLGDGNTARPRPQAGRGWSQVGRSASWPKAQAIVGGGIADYMQADRFVRIELRTLRTHLT